MVCDKDNVKGKGQRKRISKYTGAGNGEDNNVEIV